MRETKEKRKKTKKRNNDIIQVNKSEEEEEKETARIKQKDFDVYYLIAIGGEMDKEFAKITNKQGTL